MPIVELTEDELELLREALDSHKYWQLSDMHYRSDGFVREPGSDDPEMIAAIAACEALERRLG